MEYLAIDGERVPRLGLGTWELEGVVAGNAVREALELGYRHIDTAQIYGNEAVIGEALAAVGVPREELFLTTKLWRDCLRADAVAPGLQASLDRLRTDYVDLLLIHWPVSDVPVAETVAAMDELRRAGRVRLLGVSNFPARLFREAADAGPVRCNQIEYHPYLDQRPLLDLARKLGAFLTAYSPLARGEALTEHALVDLGRRHDKTPAQVVLRWLLQREGTVVIPKSTRREHLAANLELWDFELDAGEEDIVAGLACGRRLIDPAFAPDW